MDLQETKTDEELVYCIYEGNVNEAGGIQQEAYRDIKVALEIASQIVEENQRIQDGVYTEEEQSREGKPYKWKDFGNGKWTNGIDEVQILHLNLK